MNPLAIPFHRPDLGEEEAAAAAHAVRSGWLTTGSVSEALEEGLADYLGRDACLLVNSGTAAMQLLLRSAGVEPGDQVVLPALTHIGTAEAVESCGARPVFADVCEDSLCLDPASAAAAVTERTRALMPVHYAGRPCDMAALGAVAATAGAAVVEDAAHALTTVGPGGRRVGQDTAGAALSFYATKELCLGEGGAVVTDDTQAAAAMRRWALHGIEARPVAPGDGRRDYDVVEHGHKMNVPDVLAALGMAQLARMDPGREQRTAVADRYLDRLADLDEITLPDPQAGDTRLSWHLFSMRVAGRGRRDALADDLRDSGIGTSVHFRPLTHMTWFRERWGTAPGQCPVSDAAGATVLSLPIYPGLTESESDRVVAAVRGFFAA